MFRYSSTGVLIMGETGHIPVTSPLLANLVLRLILGPLALLASWVPMRQLWKNGEFPAYVFVASNWFYVLLVFLNAAIWHDQDFDHWWLGYGWCDIQIYLQFALSTIYSASICAIMRRLSIQVGLTRVANLSGSEKRSQLVVQALIIFPVPLLQVILTIFVQGQRYMLAPVNGCNRAYYGNAIYLVFFIFPSPIFTAAACFHAYQTYRKFRQVEATTRLALNGSNSAALSRSQRTRRKLYLMVLSILLPYAPVEAVFCAFDMILGWPWNSPSTFHYVHFAGEVPWNSINIVRYDKVSFSDMNMNWIPIITAFVIFAFFGTSKEGINTYRRWCVFFGLGLLFPKLKQEYDPDRARVGSARSARCSEGTQASTLDVSASRSRKGSLVPTYRIVYSVSGRATGTDDPNMQIAGVAVPAPSAWRSGLRSLFQRARMWSTSSAAVDELELERNVAPFAASPSLSYGPLPTFPSATSAMFKPGFNWATPPRVPALSVPLFLKKTTVVSTVTPASVSRPLDTLDAPNVPAASLPKPLQALYHGNSCRRSHPLPISPVSPTDEETIDDVRESPALPKLFDGRNTLGTAVSTRVWANGEQQEQQENTLGNKGDMTALASANSPSKQTSAVGQGIVRVDRCITSKMTGGR